MLNLTADDFDQELSNKKYTVVDFWAVWCGPCKTFGPIFTDAAEENNNENIAFAKVDIDSENPLALRCGVQSIPSVIIFDQDGEVVDKKIGAMPKEDLIEWVIKVTE
jgi:thioredoxin 1